MSMANLLFVRDFEAELDAERAFRDGAETPARVAAMLAAR